MRPSGMVSLPQPPGGAHSTAGGPVSDPRPLPDDPDAETVAAMFLLGSDEWWLGDEGQYISAAGETWREGGTGWQRVVMVEWPGRRNRTREHKMVRMMMSPEDAIGLGKILLHTGRWMLDQ